MLTPVSIWGVAYRTCRASDRILPRRRGGDRLQTATSSGLSSPTATLASALPSALFLQPERKRPQEEPCERSIEIPMTCFVEICNDYQGLKIGWGSFWMSLISGEINSLSKIEIFGCLPRPVYESLVNSFSSLFESLHWKQQGRVPNILTGSKGVSSIRRHVTWLSKPTRTTWPGFS